jgi:hypothetical protein
MADKNRDLGQQGKGVPGEGAQSERSDQESGRPVQLDEKGKSQPGHGGQGGHPGSGPPATPKPPQPTSPPQPTGQPNR